MPGVVIIVVPVTCYLAWLLIKLQRLSRRKHRLLNRFFVRASGATPPMRFTAKRRRSKE